MSEPQTEPKHCYPPRCLIVTTCALSEALRGAEKQAVLLAAGLRRRGWDARMAVPPGSRAQRAAAEAGVPWVALRVRVEFSPWAFLRLHRAARAFRPSILHLNDPHAISLGGYARWFRTAPLVLGHRRMAKRPHQIRTYLLGVEGVIAISEAARDVLVAAGYPAQRTAVAYSCVDPLYLHEPGPDRRAARERMGLPADAFVFLVVSAIVRGKDHATLLRALARVAEASAVPVSLLVVGDGALRPEMERLAGELRIAPRVRFTGTLQGPDLIAAYRASDVFVYGSHYEGLGLAVLEAQAMGLPLIAGRAPGVTEAVAEGRTALLTPCGDASALADAMNRMIDDAALRRRLADAGPAWVRSRFTEDNMVRSVLAAYDRFWSWRPRRGPA